MNKLDKIGFYKFSDHLHKATIIASESKSDLNIALKMELLQMKNYMNNVNVQELTKNPQKFINESNIKKIIDLIDKLETPEIKKIEKNMYIA